MDPSKAFQLISDKYNKIKNYVFWVENKNFPKNKGRYSKDVTQEFFLKIHGQLTENINNTPELLKLVDRFINLRTYSIYKMVLQLIVDNYRRESKYVTFDYIALPRHIKNKLVEWPGDVISGEKTIDEKIDDYVKTFYWFDKQVFELYKYEFKTHTIEMSKKTRLSPSTIYRTVKRCKVKIKRKLTNDYYE